ncbi:MULTISPECIES: flagellar protein FlaG [unclassified Pseudoalteromonas]|jgi:flagellar protein FlaG|uniref:flagellar protein FlaG n=1 Tax=unclassified Pseudoalteromonas TaxID=194690 RepID=UPI0004185D47|nr:MULTISPECIES: flagellar protein FlaG [unclassified Pseudoalteromonas]MDC9497151.1 flagellar protein FlaG [Pseudoalteromonas sp. Angola-20]MDC9517604.1 flagellar protein FlaG [Pseudoalteromonas sp. Angola-22]MDC9534127.1 flagellar protein FlaG [Pseudoalteromonas sp. Angola-9]TMP82215.1 TonB system transport protein TonB [Pseudoalteromonas sp. S983]
MNTIALGAERLALPANTERANGQTGGELPFKTTSDTKANTADAQQSSNSLNNTKQNKLYPNSSLANAGQQPLEREQLEKVAQQLQDFMGEMNRSLQFQVDEDSGRDVIKVLDKDTGDIIKQYPSEEVLSLVSKLSETAGLLIDQTV